MAGLGNPAPLGLLSFGMTTAMLMYVDMGWAETEFEEMVAGYAIFYGGLGQLLVAILEIIKGSSFSFAVFGSYAAFWLGWGLVFLQNHSTTSDFGGSSTYENGKTLWFVQWGVLTACFLIMTLRKNTCLIVVFSLLTTTFFLLAAASGSGNDNVKKVGGYMGFATAVGAWYTGVAELINEEYGRHILPGLKPIHSPERFVISKESMQARCSYDSKSNTMFLQFRGIQVKSHQNVQAIRDAVVAAIQSTGSKLSKVHVVVDYEDVYIADAIVDEYWQMVADLEREYYLSAKRFHISSFGTSSRTNSAATTMRKATESRANEQDLEAQVR
jgi:hypothetical protein